MLSWAPSQGEHLPHCLPCQDLDVLAHVISVDGLKHVKSFFFFFFFFYSQMKSLLPGWGWNGLCSEERGRAGGEGEATVQQEGKNQLSVQRNEG